LYPGAHGPEMVPGTASDAPQPPIGALIGG
jgi:hypothetical protein